MSGCNNARLWPWTAGLRSKLCGHLLSSALGPFTQHPRLGALPSLSSSYLLFIGDFEKAQLSSASSHQSHSLSQTFPSTAAVGLYAVIVSHVYFITAVRSQVASSPFSVLSCRDNSVSPRTDPVCSYVSICCFSKPVCPQLSFLTSALGRSRASTQTHSGCF